MEENSANTNLIVKTTSLTMHIVSDYIRPGDTVVDCTMGSTRGSPFFGVYPVCTQWVFT